LHACLFVANLNFFCLHQLFPCKKYKIAGKRLATDLAHRSHYLSPVVGGVVGHVEKDVAHAVFERLAFGVGVADQIAQVNRIQYFQRGLVVLKFQRPTNVESMRLKNPIWRFPKDAGIPYLVCIENVAEQTHRLGRDQCLMLLNEVDEQGVEVVVVEEQVAQEGLHVIGFFLQK